MKSENLLAEEKSPYLLQHKNNPVDWHPWGTEAFERARKEKKPIFLSIGYSTCYWCHVMEKDSFEVEEVAEILNAHFIAIKVDREERPDVDQVYMDAVMAISGHGGWPMSVFLTPDLKPFYGGTFFWKKQFVSILSTIDEQWRKDPAQFLEASQKITDALKRSELEDRPYDLNEEAFNAFLNQLEQAYDSKHGGFGRAPKFPPSMKISLLFRIHKKTGSKSALEMALKTLDYMAAGGMYDQLGGGFARYSTDEKWLVPHFEKMLYDNALLTNCYLEAFQLTKNKSYSQIAKETLDYVLNDMTSSEGGFYSAEDAGEVGKEGEFYVWSHKELRETLSEDELLELKKIFQISEVGNFEHATNILSLNSGVDPADKNSDFLASAEQKLLAARNKRKRPHKDDKILCSWNGLMISAMARGHQILGETKYLIAAQNSAAFISQKLFPNDKLLRRYREGESRFPALLDDHAYLIQGLINLYESDHQEKWVNWAVELQQQQNELFWDQESHAYFYSRPDDESIINRKKEFHDGAEPSANGISALNLLRLFELTAEKEHVDRFEHIISAASSRIAQYPTGHPSLLIALDYRWDNSKEIVVIGDPESQTASKIKALVAETFLPNKITAFGQPAELSDETRLAIFRGKEKIDDKPTIYVCESGRCKLPTVEAEKAKELLLA
ncbi:hypothetical protein BVY02_02225 [bacterium J17]|nr:hypothetical protein BVY02_02225 [bacterium J17]